MIPAMLAGGAFVATVLVAGAGGRAGPRAWRSAAGLGVVAVALAVLILTRSPIALAASLVAGALGRDLLRRERERRDRRRLARLAPTALDVTAARARAGTPLVVALAELDVDQRRALGLGEVIAALGVGGTLGGALPTPDGTGSGLVVAAVRILERTGAPPASVLERVADRLRARTAGQALTRSESGQQLASAAVMAALPILTAFGLVVTSDRAAEFYLHTVGGAVLLAVSTGLSIASWYWMRALISRDLRW